jgi:hypothetical protein
MQALSAVVDEGTNIPISDNSINTVPAGYMPQRSEQYQ